MARLVRDPLHRTRINAELICSAQSSARNSLVLGSSSGLFVTALVERI